MKKIIFNDVLSGANPAASIQETLEHINATLKSDSHGPYSNYCCKEVSWDDVHRGMTGSNLSCWGANITDTRLHAKDGRSLFTVRGDNWNERLGKVSSSDIALVASSYDGDGGYLDLRPVTLKTVLSNPSSFGSYAGLIQKDLTDEILDKEVSVRFQTTFLPVQEGDRSTLEFAPEMYNYNTLSDKCPRNLIFLCTTQGMAIQLDGKGAKILYHHSRKGNNEAVRRYWLEVESSNHKVGGSQVETNDERDDALKRGKATSSVIGIKALGSRFNALMTIQVPLEQIDSERQKVRHKQQRLLLLRHASRCLHNGDNCPITPHCTIMKELWRHIEDCKDSKCSFQHCLSSRYILSHYRRCKDYKCQVCAPARETILKSQGETRNPVGRNCDIVFSSTSGMSSSESYQPDAKRTKIEPSTTAPPPLPALPTVDPPSSESPREAGVTPAGGAQQETEVTLLRSYGKSSAARVSRGSLVDTWDGLSIKEPKRHPTEHITVTIVLYYTCSGGIPTETDVKKAIDDLETLYQSMDNGYLGQDKFDFMKSDLTDQNLKNIETKISSQPPRPSAPINSDIFPTS